jgi:transcriptional regulator with XRE-family HTH domain/DNA-directed RNA polymerase subunit RPC12/RpoP
MDQQKIGAFIAGCRHERGLTQSALAERLGITDRAVSKWERGKCLPDAGIMLELCEVLGIGVNELLTGERLENESYRRQAEINLLALARQEEESNRRMLRLEYVIGYSCTAAFLMLIWAASYAVASRAWQIAMIVLGSVLFAVGTGTCIWIEHGVGYYECPACGERYIPAMRAVLLAPHIGRSRRMRCPHCGERGYHKKVLTK